MATTPTPPQDHAEPILSGEPSITDEQRASLWDAFHTKSADELVQHLQLQNIPDETKQALLAAKQESTPAVSPMDKVTAAMTHMSKLPAKLLELAESHPTVLKTLMAALEPPKPAAGKAASKRSSTPKAPKASAPEQPASSDADATSTPIPTTLQQSGNDKMSDPDTRFNAARHEAAH